MRARGEGFEKKYRIRAKRYVFEDVVHRVSELFDIPAEMIIRLGRKPGRIAARSVAAFWAETEPGMKGAEVSLSLGMSQSTICRAVGRGEQWVILHNLRFEK